MLFNVCRSNSLHVHSLINSANLLRDLYKLSKVSKNDRGKVESILRLKTAISLRKSDANLCVTLAIWHYDDGNKAEAEKWFLEALR